MGEMGSEMIATDVTSEGFAVFWAVLGVVFLVSAVLCGVKRHWVLLIVGFVFPMVWIVGAALPRPALARGAQKQTAQ